MPTIITTGSASARPFGFLYASGSPIASTDYYLILTISNQDYTLNGGVVKSDKSYIGYGTYTNHIYQNQLTPAGSITSTKIGTLNTGTNVLYIRYDNNDVFAYGASYVYKFARTGGLSLVKSLGNQGLPVMTTSGGLSTFALSGSAYLNALIAEYDSNLNPVSGINYYHSAMYSISYIYAPKNYNSVLGYVYGGAGTYDFYGPPCCTSYLHGNSYLHSPGNYYLTYFDTINDNAPIMITGLNTDSEGNTCVVLGDYYHNYYHIIKFDTSGNKLWARKWTQPYDYVSPTKICFDSANNIYITTQQYVYNPYFYIVKYDKNGNAQWFRSFTINGEVLDVLETDISNYDPAHLYINIRYSYWTGCGYDYIHSVLKVPTDGSLTQTFILNGRTWNYAAISVAESSSSITFTSATAPSSTSFTPTSTSASDSIAATTTATSVIKTL